MGDAFTINAAAGLHIQAHIGHGFRPARGGKIHPRGTGHAPAGLQVVYHQHFPGRDAQNAADFPQGPGRGLPEAGGERPIVDQFRLRRTPGAIIPADIRGPGMGHHADMSAGGPESAQQLGHAGEHGGMSRRM